MGVDEPVNGGGKTEAPFFTGVIEGFYNRPWTKSQRLDLFRKLNKYKMNSYLYAPKDDCKHRAFWRELYTVNAYTVLICNGMEDNVLCRWRRQIICRI